MTALQNTDQPIILPYVMKISFAHELFVNGRQLYRALAVQELQYEDWIKGVIEKNGYEEGSDFAIFIRTTEGQVDGELNHHLTVQITKEIALASDNTKDGQIINDYLKDYEYRYYGIELECRGIFNSTRSMQEVAIYRVWHWIAIATGHDDLRLLLSSNPQPNELEGPLLFELFSAIKEKFPNHVSEHEVNSFIHDWQPVAFSEIRA